MKTYFMSLLVLVLVQAAIANSALAYSGSSFNEVLKVIDDRGVSSDPKELAEIKVYENSGLPQYEVSFKSLGNKLFEASKRTLRDQVDHYPRLEKLVHSNGVCVSGEWQIDANSPYTGYFKKGSRALFVGRISVALENTVSTGKRGFGLAGKIFPTTNPTEVVPTTNFFTVDVLSGTKAKRFLDVALTNDPPLHPSLDIAGVLAKIIPAFLKADTQPTFRPVTQIARTQETSAIKSPIFMRLRASAETLKNDQVDFRNEVLEAMQRNGKMKFIIEGSETTSDRNKSEGWKALGSIVLDHAIVSYGCDRRLHFAHPKDDKSNKTKQ
ncbi:MAG: hypothetical protein V4736_02535 [Bdellovibrionota bacterium]